MMVDLTLLQSVSYIAGALGVCVAAAYYVLNLREVRLNRIASNLTTPSSYQSQSDLETRHAKLFMDIPIFQPLAKWISIDALT